ncbi:hypothetical protein [Actinomycetospora sp. NBRC 106375]|uniref:hypothetical protein n=1 Tax=Actinomycetospora sp. NBRC 106375 TaxID=3032207 RepID=UPI0025524BD0|nr:hypothetical protein [Actinomycetospora sp. NBRC 106375]
MQRSVVVVGVSVLLLLGGVGPALAAPPTPSAPEIVDDEPPLVAPAVAWWTGTGLALMAGAAGVAGIRHVTQRR